MSRGFLEGRRARLQVCCLQDRRAAQGRMTELLGVCRGVIADGVANEAEVEYLIAWFEANREAVDQWPASVLLSRLDLILEDNVIEPHELEDLAALLRDVAETERLPEFGEKVSATHVLTAPAPAVLFPGRAFVFTGEFLCDSRGACERAVQDRGGLVKSSVSSRTDYVVIGTIAAPEWIHGNYGTKVARALECGVPIVSEEHWAAHL